MTKKPKKKQTHKLKDITSGSHIRIVDLSLSPGVKAASVFIQLLMNHRKNHGSTFTLSDLELAFGMNRRTINRYLDSSVYRSKTHIANPGEDLQICTFDYVEPMKDTKADDIALYKALTENPSPLVGRLAAVLRFCIHTGPGLKRDLTYSEWSALPLAYDTYLDQLKYTVPKEWSAAKRETRTKIDAKTWVSLVGILEAHGSDGVPIDALAKSLYVNPRYLAKTLKELFKMESTEVNLPVPYLCEDAKDEDGLDQEDMHNFVFGDPMYYMSFQFPPLCAEEKTALAAALKELVELNPHLEEAADRFTHYYIAEIKEPVVCPFSNRNLGSWRKSQRSEPATTLTKYPPAPKRQAVIHRPGSTKYGPVPRVLAPCPR